MDSLGLSRLPFAIDFDALWALKPETKHIIYICSRYTEVPRYSQSYMRDYAYSGGIAEAKELPDIFESVLAYARDYDPRFNQVLVNWYVNGNHYIGAHSDDEKQLVPNTPIMSISLGATRIFRIRQKPGRVRVRDIALEDGDVVIMKGGFQKQFTHEITKVGGKKGAAIGRRINITLRCFAR